MGHASVAPKKLDDLFEKMVREGLITPDQLTLAKVSKADLGEDLGHLLIKRGFVNIAYYGAFLAT